MKENRNVFTIIFSAISLIASIVALAVALPRVQLGIDYLGVIVAILGAFATLLLAMQLYNVFSVKEDAKKVADAKAIIEKYAQQVSDLDAKIRALEEKADKAIYIDELSDDVKSVSNEIEE